MSSQKTIAVMGATGMQGGGLVRAIMNDPAGGFACRAVTRNPSSDEAQALKSLGAKIVKADLDDIASLEKAFAGAYGAFCLTKFWGAFFGRERKGTGEEHGRGSPDSRP